MLRISGTMTIPLILYESIFHILLLCQNLFFLVVRLFSEGSMEVSFHNLASVEGFLNAQPLVWTACNYHINSQLKIYVSIASSDKFNLDK